MNEERERLIEEIWQMRPKLVAYLRKLRVNNEEVEDCASEACLRAVSKIEQFDPAKGTLEHWLIRIAYYTFVSRRRQWEDRIALSDFLSDIISI